MVGKMSRKQTVIPTMGAYRGQWPEKLSSNSDHSAIYKVMAGKKNRKQAEIPNMGAYRGQWSEKNELEFRP